MPGPADLLKFSIACVAHSPFVGLTPFRRISCRTRSVPVQAGTQMQIGNQTRNVQRIDRIDECSDDGYRISQPQWAAALGSVRKLWMDAQVQGRYVRVNTYCFDKHRLPITMSILGFTTAFFCEITNTFSYKVNSVYYTLALGITYWASVRARQRPWPAWLHLYIPAALHMGALVGFAAGRLMRKIVVPLEPAEQAVNQVANDAMLPQFPFKDNREIIR